MEDQEKTQITQITQMDILVTLMIMIMILILIMTMTMILMLGVMLWKNSKKNFMIH